VRAMPLCRMIERSVPMASSGWSGTETVIVPASVRRCITHDCRVAKPPRSSFPMHRFEARDKHFGMKPTFDFRRVSGFKEQFDRYFEIGCRTLKTIAV
jgi:hypothetical protein